MKHTNIAEQDILNPQQQQNTHNKYKNKNKLHRAQSVSSQCSASTQYTHVQNRTRLKYRYTKVQTPHRSHTQTIIMVILIILVVAVVVGSYVNKVQAVRIHARQAQQQCHKQYIDNKCQHNMRPALRQFCDMQFKCWHTDQQQYYNMHIKHMEILGHMIREFVQGAGIIVAVTVLILLYALAKGFRHRQVKTSHEEYY